MKFNGIAAAAVFALAAGANAWAADTPLQITNRHISEVKAARLAGIVADYADNAVVVTPPGMASPQGVYVGKQKVGEFFGWLIGAGNLPALKSMVSTTELVAPDTVVMRWTQFPGAKNQVKGTDVFVIRGGKIVFQSVAPAP